MSTERPIVIAHRGAPGERLEHTVQSYALAIEQGCDYIEPDVVSSRDGVLVVRHENEISGTTDVADRAEFSNRQATKTIDGTDITGWFTEDFTLAELKTLRCRERLPKLRPQNVPLNGWSQILTFDEVLAIAELASAAREKPIGVYVETKHPTYFGDLDLNLNELLLGDLQRRGLGDADAKVVIQSMETGNLRELRDRTPLTLVQLMTNDGAPYDLQASGDRRTYADLVSASELADIASYADGIGPHKSLVIPRDSDGRLTEPSSLVDDAHGAGLLVHTWTHRNENEFLPDDLRSSADPAAHGDAEAEYAAYLNAGVDGVFSDYPGAAVAAVGRYFAG